LGREGGGRCVRHRPPPPYVRGGRRKGGGGLVVGVGGDLWVSSHSHALPPLPPPLLTGRGGESVVFMIPI
jgi:hypothetical protein